MRRLTAAAMALLLTSIVLVAGCSSNTPDSPGHDDHSGTPGPGTVTAEDVSQVWLSTIYAWQPVTDDSPTDALIRARHLAVGDLADPKPPTKGTRPIWPQWSAWRDSKDVITAKVSDLTVVQLSGTTAAAKARVTQVVMHSDASSTPLQDLDVSVSLTQLESGRWRVSDFRQTPR